MAETENRDVQLMENGSGSYSSPATSDEVLRFYVIHQFNEQNESFSHNTIMFDPLNIVECWLMVNNARVPNVSYTTEFPYKNYYRLFAVFLGSELNYIDDEWGCLLDCA